VTFAPSFFRRSPLFWPIAEAASRLEHFRDWPAPSDLQVLFDGVEGTAPVRFETAAPRPRRRPSRALPRYDERIARDRVVPTRERSWHDLLNALVWATFPRAKLALHQRQDRMIAARIAESGRLPEARSKEQDAVAMLDEGGVVVLRAAGDNRDVSETQVIFGHALYEGLACGGGPAAIQAAAYVAPVDGIPHSARERVFLADAALARLLARDEPIGRADLGSVLISSGASDDAEGETNPTSS
jgi:hypothetical protein